MWNIDNIYEDVYSIDRMERPVDNLCTADNVFKALTITRNCLGLWNLEDGRLIKTLSSGGISIISAAKITSNGLYIVSAESGKHNTTRAVCYAVKSKHKWQDGSKLCAIRATLGRICYYRVPAR